MRNEEFEKVPAKASNIVESGKITTFRLVKPIPNIILTKKA